MSRLGGLAPARPIIYTRLVRNHEPRAKALGNEVRHTAPGSLSLIGVAIILQNMPTTLNMPVLRWRSRRFTQKLSIWRYSHLESANSCLLTFLAVCQSAQNGDIWAISSGNTRENMARLTRNSAEIPRVVKIRNVRHGEPACCVGPPGQYGCEPARVRLLQSEGPGPGRRVPNCIWVCW